MNKIRITAYAVFVLVGTLLVACQPQLLLEPSPTPPPPTPTPAPTETPAPDPYSGAGFDLFLTQVEASRLVDRPVLVNRYLAQLPAGPLTDGRRAIFLWRGEARSVHVIGDMNNWGHSGDPAGEPTLRHVDGTDLWLGEGEYEADARLDYTFIIDGERRALDPLNLRSFVGRDGPVSVLAMPAYDAPPAVQAVLSGQTGNVPAGTIAEHTLSSSYLNETRTFFVYTPASQIIGARPPTLLLLDGGDYLTLIDAPALLDQLIADGDVPPLVAVFVPPINRAAEYDRNDSTVAFLADELLPFVQETYDTNPDPAQTAVAGPALGGLQALYAAVTRPGAFGLAASFSGMVGMGEDALARRAQQAAPLPLRLYLVAGLYETAVGAGNADVLAANRRLAQTLQASGYDFHFQEAPQGHSWGLWRDTFGPALHYLYGAE